MRSRGSSRHVADVDADGDEWVPPVRSMDDYAHVNDG